MGLDRCPNCNSDMRNRVFCVKKDCIYSGNDSFRAQSEQIFGQLEGQVINRHNAQDIASPAVVAPFAEQIAFQRNQAFGTMDQLGAASSRGQIYAPTVSNQASHQTLFPASLPLRLSSWSTPFEQASDVLSRRTPNESSFPNENSQSRKRKRQQSAPSNPTNQPACSGTSASIPIATSSAASSLESDPLLRLRHMLLSLE